MSNPFLQLVEVASEGLLSSSACVVLSCIADSVEPKLEGSSRDVWQRMGLVEKGYLIGLASNSMWHTFHEHIPVGLSRQDWRAVYHSINKAGVPLAESKSTRQSSLYELTSLIGGRIMRKLNLSWSLCGQLMEAAATYRRAEFDRLLGRSHPHLTEGEIDNVFGAFNLVVRNLHLAEAMLEFRDLIYRVYHEGKVVTPEGWRFPQMARILRSDDFSGGTGMLSDMVTIITRTKKMEWTLDDVRKLLGKFLRDARYKRVLKQLQQARAMDRIEDSPLAPLELFVVKLLYSYARSLKSDEGESYEKFSDVFDQDGSQPEPDVKGTGLPVLKYGAESGNDRFTSRLPNGRKRKPRQTKSLQVVSMPPSMTR